MTSQRNPFRSRTSEQERQAGLGRFLRTFGAGALDMLPEEIWDRPVLIQSAPGAGKTSLLRTFSAEALRHIATHPDKFEELNDRMVELGALHEGKLRLLGIRLTFKRDYAMIDDLGAEPEAAAKIFFRLLDAKLIRAVAEALTEAGFRSEQIRWEASAAGSDALAALGGPALADVVDWAHSAHRELLRHLDSVLPPAPEDLKGHHTSYAVHALNGARFTVDGKDIGVRPLLLFDEGQDLGRDRRDRLLDVLADRDLELHRWMAERYQALTADEIIGDGEIDRGYKVVHIEAQARELGTLTRRGHKTRGFEKLLVQIANLRAGQTLTTTADEDRDFTELLDEALPADDPRIRSAHKVLDDRLKELATGEPRYDDWLAWAGSRAGQRGAVERRVVEILITKDQRRRQDTLFTVALSEDELKGRFASDLVEAAGIFLRKELNLPFYAGPSRLAKLATENIDQHLTLCGELFEEVLARITLNRPLELDPVRQDRIVWKASDKFWRSIPPRLPNGRAIQQLLLHIAALCRKDTFRPTAPYPPGATGTAISMRDRERLIDPAWRAGVNGAEELYVALSGAIGHNLLQTRLDYPVKNDLWMVLYLNRMLCARFGLPLGYGGFRERPLEEVCKWMSHRPPDEEDLLETFLQERLAV